MSSYGHEIGGPDCRLSSLQNSKKVSTSTDKIKALITQQRNFQRYFVYDTIYKRDKAAKEKLESCWCIASDHSLDNYYIDVSKEGKGFIYSSSRDGKARLYTRNIIEFLFYISEDHERL